MASLLASTLPSIHSPNPSKSLLHPSLRRPSLSLPFSPRNRRLSVGASGDPRSIPADEWGEKAEPEPEAPSRPDPPRDEDEWGRDAGASAAAAEATPGYFSGNGSNPGVSESDKLGDLKRCLVDSLYGTELGFRAGGEARAEILELVNQLEAENPTPAPTERAELLDGKWILLCRTFRQVTSDRMVERCIAVDREYDRMTWGGLERKERYIAFVRRCSDAGNSEANCILGVQLLSTHGERYAGISRLLRAKESGHEAAAYILGMLYFQEVDTRVVSVELLNMLATWCSSCNCIRGTEPGCLILHCRRKTTSLSWCKTFWKLPNDMSCANAGCGRVIGSAWTPDDELRRTFCSPLCRYTSFSELLPLLAVGAIPLLKVKQISQTIDTRSLTIENATTLSSPLATLSLSATASFEVRSPSRIQVQFKEGTFQPPEISSSLDLPENIDIFGQKINLSPIQRSLNPVQEAVANITRTISGQRPLKVPIPGNRSSSWLLITYLDENFRISRGDGGLFILAKEGSPLLYQL